MGTDALAYTLTLSIIPFFVGKITVGIGLKTTLQNCTITSMQDFDYYRDKLTGLSPATISISYISCYGKISQLYDLA